MLRRTDPRENEIHSAFDTLLKSPDIIMPTVTYDFTETHPTRGGAIVNQPTNSLENILYLMAQYEMSNQYREAKV